jgi:hypothetical protein
LEESGAGAASNDEYLNIGALVKPQEILSGADILAIHQQFHLP